ncbi:leucine efflux protein LeuE [Micromonospora cathayae]|uniref:Leucine efflux protein LeuE n=1 Tax=Micromonospora cathayae TaxID=3028804 RepID=A0ABY7ZX35_9ACTN|nr:leucine efflux protein LeuE [Micromonospora sp. HUAS 3]WDZ87565.1 leucine efflux protein LeuE [Micromonospora sp. HUAS 3]
MMADVLGITDFWTFVLGTVAIVLLPGPNSLFVLSTAARRGVGAGYRAAAGVFVGDALLMVLSAAGVASLLTAYPPLFLVIKYAGAAYLGYLGLVMLRGAWRRWRTRHDPATPRLIDSAEPAALRAPFRRALLISIVNPKAILFFISFFIQFVEPTYPWPALSFLALGLIVQVTSALYLTALIFAGTFLATQFRTRRRLTATATTGVAALFLGFSLKLATASAG